MSKTHNLVCVSCGATSPPASDEDTASDLAIDAGWMVEGHNEDDEDRCPACIVTVAPDE